jgi:hypothetical protein
MVNAAPRRIAWKILHQTILCVHSNEAPSDDDWDAHLKAVKAAPDLQRIVVFTHGGAPNATQRAALNSVLRNVRVPIAILTPSLLARGAGTALRWFNPLMRIFDPDDVERAFDHIGAPNELRRELGLELGALKREVAPNR